VFERFTDRSRRVLVLAQEEARLLNHSFIGTEHILLGLILEREGVAAKALESLDISLEAVHHKVEETIGMAGTAPSGSPPFTPRAKKVLELALREALQLGHSYIGTEHLLLGLLSEGEGVAATVLVSLGTDLNRVRQRVMQFMSGTAGEVYVEGTATARGVALRFGDEHPMKRGPLCPQCRANLTEEARHRTMSVTSENESDDPISLDVVFCQRCGVIIEVFKSEG
jgi:ATP-dependent Clp protease ATP-binding subunit ClpC